MYLSLKSWEKKTEQCLESWFMNSKCYFPNVQSSNNIKMKKRKKIPLNSSVFGDRDQSTSLLQSFSRNFHWENGLGNARVRAWRLLENDHKSTPSFRRTLGWGTIKMFLQYLESYICASPSRKSLFLGDQSSERFPSSCGFFDHPLI